MSRHTVKPLDPIHEITIGWDPPLRTYFVQVFRPTPHTWVGRGRRRPVCEYCGLRRDAPGSEYSEQDTQKCPETDPTEVMWRGFGAAMNDALTLEEAEKLLEPFAVVSPELHAQLLQDERWNQ